MAAALLAACGSTPAASSARTPASSGTPASSASEPGTNPTPAVASGVRMSPAPPPLQAGFPGCSIPFVQPAGNPQNFQGGWVRPPSAAFSVDPNGGFSLSGDNTPSTTSRPVLIGSFSTTVGSYDRAVKRWLPVSRDAVRADGLAYAYAEAYKAHSSDPQANRTHIHVVSLVDGSNRIIYSGGPFVVVAYEPEGIYLADVTYYAGEGTSGLRRLNPVTGAITQIFTAGFVVQVANGVAWILNSGLQANRLTSVDIRSGAQKIWADVGGVGWLGFRGEDASGHPFIWEQAYGGADPGVLMAFTGPGAGRPIGNGEFGFGLTDHHGTWFSGGDGIYLYSGGRMTKVGSPLGIASYPAGACA